MPLWWIRYYFHEANTHTLTCNLYVWGYPFNHLTVMHFNVAVDSNSNIYFTPDHSNLLGISPNNATFCFPMLSWWNIYVEHQKHSSMQLFLDFNVCVPISVPHFSPRTVWIGWFLFFSFFLVLWNARLFTIQ